jgi:hypothetical protein
MFPIGTICGIEFKIFQIKEITDFSDQSSAFKMETARTGMPRSFADFLFYKLKVCGNPASRKSIGAIFPTACTHFVSLCHILVILAIFQTFSVLLYLCW